MQLSISHTSTVSNQVIKSIMHKRRLSYFLVSKDIEGHGKMHTQVVRRQYSRAVDKDPTDGSVFQYLGGLG